MKKEKVVLGVFFCLLFAQACGATHIRVVLDRDSFILGERVKITLYVVPTEKVGGRLTVYRNMSNGTQTTLLLVKELYRRPYPWECLACGAMAYGSPLSDPVEEVFYFEPKEPGQYLAEANFGGASTRAIDGKSFIVLEYYNESSTSSTVFTQESTTSTTTTIIQYCGLGVSNVLKTSEDESGRLLPKLSLKNREHKIGDEYYSSAPSDDEIHLSGYSKNRFDVYFYVPADLGVESSVYVKAGTEEGLQAQINLTLGGNVAGTCNISGTTTGGVSGRWGECSMELDAGFLKAGEVNAFTVVTNVVPDMFELSFIDFDYMELRCSPLRGNLTGKSSTTTEVKSTTSPAPSSMETTSTVPIASSMETTTFAITSTIGPEDGNESQSRLVYLALIVLASASFAFLLRRIK